MSERKNAVLITGIAGAIGQATAILLNGENHEIAGLDNAELPASLEEMVNTHELGSITDTDLLERAIGEANAVVHLAGWVHVVPRNEEENRKVFEINHEATREIARICKQSDKKLVFVSTVGVYGDRTDSIVDEESPVSPSTSYAHSKYLAELSVLEAGGTVLRLPLVYGAHDRGNMARMIRAIRKGRFVVPGGASAINTFCGRWNAAAAIKCVLDSEVGQRQIYLACDDEVVDFKEMVKSIAERTGSRVPFLVPRKMLASMAVAGTGLEKVLHKKMPFNLSAYKKVSRSLIISKKKIENDLGYRPVKSFWEGLDEELKWIEREGTR